MALPEITQEQRDELYRYIYGTYRSFATSTPSLAPEVEQFSDMNKALLGGIRSAIQLLFGKETSERIFNDVESAIENDFGYVPDVIPSVFGAAFESDALRDWARDDHSWKPLSDDDEKA